MLTAIVPEMVGGSADLTGSNLTRGKPQKPLTPDDYSGRYIHYGIREFGMAAAMNGMALHGGFMPYGGTFLVFSDYARPAIRLSALMGARVIYVMTHDSIGLGEDGPTHQPVEHLAALRAIPHLQVFRPADAVEVAESWQIALESRAQSVAAGAVAPEPAGAAHPSIRRRTSRPRAPISSPGPRRAEVTLFATGSEVEIAVNAKAKIEAAGRTARVVSVPCFELFDEQDAAYKAATIGNVAGSRSAIEAAVRQGWDTLHRLGRHLHRHDRLRRQRADRGRSTPISASRPRRRPMRRLRGWSRTSEPVRSRPEHASRPAPYERRRDARLSRRSNMAVRVAINGFGRIGRNILRAIVESGRTDIEVVDGQRSRPGRDQRPSAPLRFGPWPLPEEVSVDGDTSSSTARRSASRRSRIRRRCRMANRASTSRSNARASSRPATRPPRI